MPDDVDLIRFERTSFKSAFGAHERRGKQLASSRKIEQWANRNGKRIKVSAEFVPQMSDGDQAPW